MPPAGRFRCLWIKAKLAASVHTTNTCVSCHADITATHPDDNRPVPPVNCARCHEQQGESYGASVHGLARKAGHATPPPARIATARTTSCRRPRRLRRSILCGRRKPAAGATRRKRATWRPAFTARPWPTGERDAPTCTDCHSEHKIEALKDGSPLEISEVCSRCHASVYLDQKYNLPATA